MKHFRTIAFYKPYDVLSSFTDEEGRATLKQYVDIPEIYGAGRLDRDSEGLLLLSDDKRLLHRLTDPRYHLPKTYLVQVEGVITPEALGKLVVGVLIQGEMTRRCKAMAVPEPSLPPRSGKPITPHAQPSWIRLTLQEGKKRQIRHMTAAVGFPTLRLARIAIGPITLGELQPGEWRDLTPAEMSLLYKAAGIV